MKKYAVLGRKLGHSLSPLMHNMAFKACGIEAEYSAIEFEPAAIGEIVTRMASENFAGFNITIPYKTDLIRFMSHLDDSARVIGAINTVRRDRDGWMGFNTDVKGFLSPLIRLNRQFDTCVIFGNGGAARGVIYALMQKFNPKQMILCARDEQKSGKIAADLHAANITHREFHSCGAYLEDADLVINTTPLGMSPDIEGTPLDRKIHLKQDAVVYDLVYNPIETRFLREVQQNNPGVIIIGGLEMLVGQAAESFRIWTGREFPSAKVMKYLEKQLRIKNDEY